jgi:hypothetical protein
MKTSSVDINSIGSTPLDNLVKDFVLRNGLSLRTTHYKTHAQELGENLKYVEKAMLMWEQQGKPEGDIELRVPGFKGLTRLWGKKLGDRFPRNEVFYTRKRGEGRPFQDRIILRPNPLHTTNIITIAIYNNGLETIYAGPQMGPMPDAGKRNNDWQNWKDHALAYSQAELDRMEKMEGRVASSQASWSILAGGVSEARVEAYKLRVAINQMEKAIKSSPEIRDEVYRLCGDNFLSIPQILSEMERQLDKTNYALITMGEDFYRQRLTHTDRETVDVASKATPLPNVPIMKDSEMKELLSQVIERMKNS